MSFPTPPKTIPPTTKEELDKAIKRLTEGKEAWTVLPSPIPY